MYVIPSRTAILSVEFPGSAASRWHPIHPSFSSSRHTVLSAPSWHLDCIPHGQYQAFCAPLLFCLPLLTNCLAHKAKLSSHALQLSSRMHMPEWQLRRRTLPGMPCAKWRGPVGHSLRAGGPIPATQTYGRMGVHSTSKSNGRGRKTDFDP